MTNDDKKDIDQHSGVETTGHEWDGLKELNNPAPRWWLWVFFITVIWAVGYWVVYPAWPTLSGHTQGIAGWTSHKKLAEEQAEILERRGQQGKALLGKSLQEIQNDPKLYTFAIAGGKAMFKENCAACHGTGAAGGKGYPNLNDYDWIWGGHLDEIYATIKYGIRSKHDQTHMSQMPAFGRDGILKREEVEMVADYVLTLSGSVLKPTHEHGKKLFADNCSSCHGDTGMGKRELGAPNLTDGIWLYGGSRAAVMDMVTNAYGGVMPDWESRLSDDTIKAIAVYVHSLGGGEAELNKK
ncbi:MAG: cytochrome-c oxidase, cbb3-type subunit III [Rickettsiales bacterium]|jgi:cytochrome c oxidase cbb3-type subunit 3|nr:cytochrome-c oxidase, cbb3-type subunit III [Rickettsiales bacterium]